MFVLVLARRTCGASRAFRGDAGVVEIFAVSTRDFRTKIRVGPIFGVFRDVDNVSCQDCFPYLLADVWRKTE